LTDNNPAALIKPADLLKTVKAQNMARVPEKELPRLLVDIDNYKGEVLTRFGLKVALYTVARTSELIEAPWPEFDPDNARWEIARERMKMDTVLRLVLSEHVASPLDDQPDWLVKADSVFAPANTTTVKTNHKKKPTPVKKSVKKALAEKKVAA
jgi:integrase